MRLGHHCIECGYDEKNEVDYPMFETIDEIYAGVHAVRLLVKDCEYMDDKVQKDFVVCLLDLLEYSLAYKVITSPD